MRSLDILQCILTESRFSEGLEDIADEIERLIEENGMRAVTMGLAFYIRLNEFTDEEREVMTEKLREELQAFQRTVQ